MNLYPPTAVAVDGSAFLFGDRFEAFGVRNGFLVTEADNPDWTDDFQDASLFDAVVHKEGRWFVGSLYTIVLTDEAGGKRSHLCAIAPLTEIGSGAAMNWFYEHVGCVPERAREAFAKGQVLDADAAASTTSEWNGIGRPPNTDFDADAHHAKEWRERDPKKYPTRAAFENAKGMKPGDMERLLARVDSRKPKPTA